MDVSFNILKGSDIRRRKEVLVYVAFAQNGKPMATVSHCLKEFSDNGIATILVINSDKDNFDQSKDAFSHLIDLADIAVLRLNVGFDFGAWKDAFAHFESLWDIEAVYLINDSILGPITKLDTFLTDVRGSSCGFVGMTFNWDVMPHVQSYCWALKTGALKSDSVREFFRNIEYKQTKRDIIDYYEIPFFSLLQKLKIPVDILYWKPTDMGCVQIDATWGQWKLLIDRGFPFVKAALVKRNPAILDHDIFQQSPIKELLLLESTIKSRN